MLTEFQVPHTLPGWAPFGLAVMFAYGLVQQLSDARRQSARGEWIKATLEVTDLQHEWSHVGDGTPGADAYSVIGRLRTRDGRTVEARSSDVIGGTAARSAVGRTREVWYLPERPHQVRLVPPMGQGYLRATFGWLLLMVAVILFGIYATFWL